MKSEVEIIAEKALGLSSSARAYLAELLLESIDNDDDFSISSEWMYEIKRRCREIDSGAASLVEGAEAMTGIKEKWGAE